MHCKPFGVSPVDTPDIWALVNVLLNTKINSSLFNYISATNVSSKSVLIPQNKSFAIVDDKIKILYPQPNAVYNAGDTITIKLQIDTLGLQNFALIVQDQSFFDKPTKTNLEYKLIVSPEYIEGQSISVIGGYSNQDTSYISNTSINLKVNPVGSILDFNIKPEVFVIEKGKSRRPDYEAIFPNAIAQLGYTDKLTVKINDPNLLAYDETTNEFKGLAKGSTQATVTYMGITKTVFFEIIQYEEPAGDPITGINEMQADKKDELIVKAYPNPFTESVTIEYSLPDIGETRLEIFDIYGQKIKEVNFGNEPKGPYKKVVELNSLPAGIYIYKLTSGKAIQNGNIIKVSQLKK